MRSKQHAKNKTEQKAQKGKTKNLQNAKKKTWLRIAIAPETCKEEGGGRVKPEGA